MTRKEELQQRIFDVECTVEEMDQLIEMAQNGELEREKQFDKYYRLDSILKCFSLYQSGDATHGFLCKWATAYDALIHGGIGYFVPDDEDEECQEDYEPVSTKDIITSQITLWLESLSMSDDDCAPDLNGEEQYSIHTASEHLPLFKHLDRIYRSTEDWEACYTHALYDGNDRFEELEDILVLFINTVSREFCVICNSSYNFHVTRPEIPHLSYGDFFDKICELKESGYSELEY